MAHWFCATLTISGASAGAHTIGLGGSAEQEDVLSLSLLFEGTDNEIDPHASAVCEKLSASTLA
jgi:hypothetical protein